MKSVLEGIVVGLFAVAMAILAIFVCSSIYGCTSEQDNFVSIYPPQKVKGHPPVSPPVEINVTPIALRYYYSCANEWFPASGTMTTTSTTKGDTTTELIDQVLTGKYRVHTTVCTRTVRSTTGFVQDISLRDTVFGHLSDIFQQDSQHSYVNGVYTLIFEHHERVCK